ncbi:hypothetical protein BGZ73_002086 [Actinomortierella ambigua]|nr:hypothetical protein BGZ73_002086 [Actinomortierella ambigua]
MSAKVCDPAEPSPFGYGFPFHRHHGHRGHPGRGPRSHGEGSFAGPGFACGPHPPFGPEFERPGPPGGFGPGFHHGFGPHPGHHFGPGPHGRPGFGFPFAHPQHHPGHPGHMHGPPPPIPPHHFPGFGPFGHFGFGPHADPHHHRHGRHHCPRHHEERDDVAGEEDEKRSHFRDRRHGHAHGYGHGRRHCHRHHYDEREDGQAQEDSHGIPMEASFGPGQNDAVKSELDSRFKAQLQELETLYRDTVQAIDVSYKTARSARKDAYKAAKRAAKQAHKQAAVAAAAHASDDVSMEKDAHQPHATATAAAETPATDYHELRQAMKTAKKEWKESRSKVFDELQRQMVDVATQMVEELTTATAVNASASGTNIAVVDGGEKGEDISSPSPATAATAATAAAHAATRGTTMGDNAQASQHEQDRLAFILKLQTWIAAAQTRMNKAKHAREQHYADVEKGDKEHKNKRRTCRRRGERWASSPWWSYGQDHPHFSDHLYAFGNPHDPRFVGTDEATATAEASGGPFATTSSSSSTSWPLYSRPPFPVDHPHHGPPPPYATVPGPYHPRLMHKMARRHWKMMHRQGRSMHKLERKMERAHRAMTCGDRRRRGHGRHYKCKGETNVATAEDEGKCAGIKKRATTVDANKKGKRKAAAVSDMEVDGVKTTKYNNEEESEDSDSSSSSTSSWSSSDIEDEDESDLELEFELGLDDDDLSESSCSSDEEEEEGDGKGCSNNYEGKDDKPMSNEYKH